MTKKGPLTKVEKFYIENHVESLTAKEISETLDRTEKIVSNYINKLEGKTPKKETKEKPKKPTTKPKSKRSKMDNLMGHKERNGQRVAAIMTPAASEYSDSKRSTRIKSDKMKSVIHKPKG